MQARLAEGATIIGPKLTAKEPKGKKNTWESSKAVVDHNPTTRRRSGQGWPARDVDLATWIRGEGFLLDRTMGLLLFLVTLFVRNREIRRRLLVYSFVTE